MTCVLGGFEELVYPSSSLSPGMAAGEPYVDTQWHRRKELASFGNWIQENPHQLPSDFV